MRTVIYLLLILVIAVVSAIVVLPYRLPPATPAPIVVHSQGPTVERLERLSHLVTTRVYVVDVLVGEGEGCRGAWLVKGDALVGVNLGRARIIENDEATKQALIVLPLPEVLQPRVDHERTKTWEVRRMVWLPWNADQDRLRDQVMLQAQQLVAQAAGSDENLQQAKTTAATIVKEFYAEVGWQVRVSWEGEPTDGKQGNCSPPGGGRRLFNVKFSRQSRGAILPSKGDPAARGDLTAKSARGPRLAISEYARRSDRPR